MKPLYQLFLIFVGVNGVSFEGFSLDRYHSHEDMTEYLEDLAYKYPNLTRLYSIGKTFRGRDLWVVEISSGEDKSFRPHVKLVGNIHGNEVVGREILLQLIKHLIDNYNKKDKNTRNLLDFAIVHILPSLNPDGFAYALNHTNTGDDGTERCMSVKGRNNIRNIDLNRNFPEPQYRNRAPLQLETRAIMEWMDQVPFVLSAALHGGALVANYPYDSRKEDISDFLGPQLTPDDDVFKHLASLYAEKHPRMHRGEPCPGPYNETFPGGITNGAAWYHLNGGMQDFNYIFHGCMELTLEISCCKFPKAAELPKFWEENKEPLMSFLGEVRRGIRGVVVDDTGTPIPNATLLVRGRAAPFWTSAHGEFWRILLPNAYSLQVHAEGFRSRNLTIRVREPEEDKWSQFINITLHRTDSLDPQEELAWSNASEAYGRSYPSSVISVELVESADTSSIPQTENSPEEYTSPKYLESISGAKSTFGSLSLTSILLLLWCTRCFIID